MSRVAYHEAAHAVVSGRLGLHIKRVFLSDDGCSGAVEYDEDFRDLDMMHWPVSNLAGPMGEQHYLGRKDALIDIHGTDDYRQASEMVWAMHGEDGAAAALARLETLAAAYVTLDWPIIERVAAALMRAKELSWPQLAPLLIRKASDR